MLAYIVRRLLFLPVVLFGITALLFALISTLGPWTRVATFIPSPDAERHVDLEAIIRKYHLDDPPLKMYLRWVKNLFRGNLGWSQSSHMTVSEAIARRFPATLELTLFAVGPVIIGGIFLGVIAAVRHNKPLDHITRILAIILWSMPDFVLGLAVLMVGFGVLGWFPPGRLSAWAQLAVLKESFVAYTGMHTIDALLNRRFDLFWDALRHLVAPVFTLACLWWAFMLRVTRSSMLEVLNQDYVRTARAKGLTERMVIQKHVLRNALIPVTTVASNMLLGLLGGVVIVETVFNYPGLGLLTATAATRLDVPCVVGVALFYAVILVVVNLVVDVLYSLIDPRVRLE